MKALLFAAGLISFVLYRAEKMGANLHRNPSKSNEKQFDYKKISEQQYTTGLYTNYILTTNYPSFLPANDTTN